MKLYEKLRSQTLAGKAALALANIDPKAKDAVPVLIEAMKDEDVVISNSAAHALHRIDPENYPGLGAE